MFAYTINNGGGENHLLNSKPSLSEIVIFIGTAYECGQAV